MIDNKNTVVVGDKTFVKFLLEEQILNRIEELAEIIRKEYQNKNPVFIIIANGAMPFATDLILRTDIECEYHCIKASSYYDSMTSSSKVELYIPLPDITGRDIIIVEDIVDSGYTMDALLKKLDSYNAKSIEIATLLNKPEARKVEINPKYVGFEIEPLFVIGYGLDYAQKGRYLKDIYILNN